MNRERLTFLMVLLFTFSLRILVGCISHHHEYCETCESGHEESCEVLHYSRTTESNHQTCLVCSISSADFSAHSVRTKCCLTDYSNSPTALLADGSVSFFSPCDEETFYEWNTECLYTHEYLSFKNLRAPPII